MTANFSNTPKVVHLIFHVSPKTYKMKIKEKRVTFVTLTHFQWYHQESNRGHKDFQSFALPTELWSHR